METGTDTILEKGKRRAAVENAAQAVFAVCAAFSVFVVAAITLYMVVSGTPAIFRVGLKEVLFGRIWAPAGVDPRYGIFYIILTSLAGTLLAVLIGVPAGVLTAVFLAEVADARLAALVRPAVELLAGIPSVIYGLLGIRLLNPLLYRLELKLFAGSRTHQFTGGSNLLAASLVLAVMILPTVVSVSETALRAVPSGVRAASLALGASRMQTVFRSVLPAARPGIVTAAVLGIGRAMGEAMAITLVSGNGVNLPLPFSSVRFLTAAIVSEMGYSEGLHRQMLFTVGLVLFGFIMIINLVLHKILKEGAQTDG